MRHFLDNDQVLKPMYRCQLCYIQRHWIEPRVMDVRKELPVVELCPQAVLFSRRSKSFLFEPHMSIIRLLLAPHPSMVLLDT